MNILTLFLIGGSLFLVSYGLLALYMLFRLPRNNPKQYLQQISSQSLPPKQKLITIGDSITHGTVSVNYVDLLSERLNREQIRVDIINAGVNGDHTFHVLNRIPEIIRCHPDFITILIGTNDVASSLNSNNKCVFFSRKKLSQPPTLASFTSNLQSLVSELKSETQANIAILSLPLIGEDLNQPVTQTSIGFSRAIQKIAKQQHIDYLPLQEAMLEHLNQYPTQPRYRYEKRHTVFVISLLRRLLGHTDQQISEKLGFRLHIDFLHLNKKGADMIVDLIEKFYIKYQYAGDDTNVH